MYPAQSAGFRIRICGVDTANCAARIFFLSTSFIPKSQFPAIPPKFARFSLCTGAYFCSMLRLINAATIGALIRTRNPGNGSALVCTEAPPPRTVPLVPPPPTSSSTVKLCPNHASCRRISRYKFHSPGLVLSFSVSP